MAKVAASVNPCSWETEQRTHHRSLALAPRETCPSCANESAYIFWQLWAEGFVKRDRSYCFDWSPLVMFGAQNTFKWDCATAARNKTCREDIKRNVSASYFRDNHLAAAVSFTLSVGQCFWPKMTMGGHVYCIIVLCSAESHVFWVCISGVRNATLLHLYSNSRSLIIAALTDTGIYTAMQRLKWSELCAKIY